MCLASYGCTCTMSCVPAFLSVIHVYVYLPCAHITTSDAIPQFVLIWSRGFAHPLHSVWYGDLTNDGLSELLIVSTGGVHIMQVLYYIL